MIFRYQQDTKLFFSRFAYTSRDHERCQRRNPFWKPAQNQNTSREASPHYEYEFGILQFHNSNLKDYHEVSKYRKIVDKQEKCNNLTQPLTIDMANEHITPSQVHL